MKTYDLGLAAALITKGYQILKVDKENPKKVEFTFQDRKSIEETATNYFNGKLEVEPQSYFNNIKTIKNRIYSN